MNRSEWVRVPRVPTEAMLGEMGFEWKQYAALLAASPSPPAALSGQFSGQQIKRAMMTAHAFLPDSVRGHPARMQWMGERFLSEIAPPPPVEQASGEWANTFKALQAAKATMVAYKFQPGPANCWEQHDEEALALVEAALSQRAAAVTRLEAALMAANVSDDPHQALDDLADAVEYYLRESK